MSNIFKNFKIRLSTMLVSAALEQVPVSKIQELAYPVLKKTFNNYRDETPDENELEIPEYISLRTEPMSQLAILRKTRVESHVIHTTDGYLLTVQRILPKLDFRSAYTISTS